MQGEGGLGGVVIVGGGRAGRRAAERLRAGGFSGPIDVIGSEQDFPYEGPPLSKTVLTAPAPPGTPYIPPPPRWAAPAPGLEGHAS